MRRAGSAYAASKGLTSTVVASATETAPGRPRAARFARATSTRTGSTSIPALVIPARANATRSPPIPQPRSITDPAEAADRRAARWAATVARVACSSPSGVKYIRAASSPSFAAALRRSVTCASAAATWAARSSVDPVAARRSWACAFSSSSGASAACASSCCPSSVSSQRKASRSIGPVFQPGLRDSVRGCAPRRTLRTRNDRSEGMVPVAVEGAGLRLAPACPARGRGPLPGGAGRAGRVEQPCGQRPGAGCPDPALPPHHPLAGGRPRRGRRGPGGPDRRRPGQTTYGVRSRRRRRLPAQQGPARARHRAVGPRRGGRPGVRAAALQPPGHPDRHRRGRQDQAGARRGQVATCPVRRRRLLRRARAGSRP